MKVSTAWNPENSRESSSKVIIFYCGPATDEAKMLTIGQNLIKEFPYTDKSGFIHYKSDQQTLQGTRATGII